MQFSTKLERVTIIDKIEDWCKRRIAILAVLTMIAWIGTSVQQMRDVPSELRREGIIPGCANRTSVIWDRVDREMEDLRYYKNTTRLLSELMEHGRK